MLLLDSFQLQVCSVFSRLFFFRKSSFRVTLTTDSWPTSWFVHMNIIKSGILQYISFTVVYVHKLDLSCSSSSEYIIVITRNIPSVNRLLKFKITDFKKTPYWSACKWQKTILKIEHSVYHAYFTVYGDRDVAIWNQHERVYVYNM